MYLFQDVNCNLGGKSKFILIAYRLGNLLYRKRNNLTAIPFFLYLAFYRVIIEWILGVELPLKVTVGKRLSVHHGVGLVINPKAILGDDVIIRNGVVIGNKGEGTGCPVIGNNVDIGANAIVIGPINIGNNVKIGAGTVVTKDVPANKTVVSAPMRIL